MRGVVIFLTLFILPCELYPQKTQLNFTFLENKGQVIDQNNNPSPSVLFLLPAQGMNVQLRRCGFSYDLLSPGKQGQAKSLTSSSIPIKGRPSKEEEFLKPPDTIAKVKSSKTL